MSSCFWTSSMIWASFRSVVVPTTIDAFPHPPNLAIDQVEALAGGTQRHRVCLCPEEVARCHDSVRFQTFTDKPIQDC